MTARQIYGPRAAILVPFCAGAMLLVPGGALQAGGSEQKAAPPAGTESFHMALGGCGGAYFLASPGKLVIEVHRRDRNRRGSNAELRAILVGPDRQVVDEAILPDDGQPRGSGFGPWQQARLTAQVTRRGVFGLNITVSQDRYGEEVVWGFQTNCPRYVIETSRGHRDERRQEPIVLANPDEPGDVCFVPRAGQFQLEVADLPKQVDSLRVYDGDDTLVQELSVGTDKTARHTFPADPTRIEKLWRLELPAQQATIQIDGVTRWNAGDPFDNLPYWTVHRDCYFPWLAYRWLLTPYHRTVYCRPGQTGALQFEVHNNSSQPALIRLEIEFPAEPWNVQLSTSEVHVAPRRSAKVTLGYSISGAEGDQRTCCVRVTPAECPEFSTYSTVNVKIGRAPAADPLAIPVLLQPYRHENEQFGYLPDYPVENQVYFDRENRPLVRAGGGVSSIWEGRWAASVVRGSDRGADGAAGGRAVRLNSSKIAFDCDNNVYVLGTAGREAALMLSTDGGRTFVAYPIPGTASRSCSFDIEQFSGHNLPDGPPPIVRYTRTAADPQRIWRRINDLDLILPKLTAGRLSFDDPIRISQQCIGISAHSGIPSSVVSRGDKVHLAWGEATDPDANVPGVPTYVATYDRQTGTLGEPALVAYGPPANDIHNSPSITIDSQGYLHVLAGTHGQPFPYVRSLQPNDAHRGWTPPELVGDGRQTYVGLVCGGDDTLHLVFRMWRTNVEPHPHGLHATLAYQRKRPNQPWEAPRVLIVAPFSDYSIFYHRLTIDRLGRLFLSYDYWSTYWFYRTDHRGDRRALLMSADAGDSWKLADGTDLIGTRLPARSPE